MKKSNSSKEKSLFTEQKPEITIAVIEQSPNNDCPVEWFTRESCPYLVII